MAITAPSIIAAPRQPPSAGPRPPRSRRSATQTTAASAMKDGRLSTIHGSTSAVGRDGPASCISHSSPAALKMPAAHSGSHSAAISGPSCQRSWKVRP